MLVAGFGAISVSGMDQHDTDGGRQSSGSKSVCSFVVVCLRMNRRSVCCCCLSFLLVVCSFASGGLFSLNEARVLKDLPEFKFPVAF